MRLSVLLIFAVATFGTCIHNRDIRNEICDNFKRLYQFKKQELTRLEQYYKNRFSDLGNKLIEIRNQVVSLDEERKQDKEQNIFLKSQLEICRNDIKEESDSSIKAAELEIRNNELSLKNKQLETEIRELRSQLNNKNKSIEELNNKLANRYERWQKFNRFIQLSNILIKNFGKRIENLSSLVKSLERSNNFYPQHLKTIHELQHQLKNIRRYVIYLKKEQHIIMKQLQAEGYTKKELAEFFSKEDTQVNDSKNRNIDLKARIIELKTLVEDLKTEGNNKVSKIEHHVLELDKQISNLSNENYRYKNNIEDIIENNEQLRNKNQIIHKKKYRIKKLKERNSELEYKANELMQLKEDCKEIKIQNQKLYIQVENLNVQLNNIKAKNKKFKSKIMSLETLVQRLYEDLLAMTRKIESRKDKNQRQTGTTDSQNTFDYD